MAKQSHLNIRKQSISAEEFIAEDSIAPTAIEHNVDVVAPAGQLQQYYNFIDYHFELADAYYRARTYIDEIDSASLYGPFKARTSFESSSPSVHHDEVLRYLKRRFLEIDELGQNGYETIWRA
jgi:hypothetical protein